MVTSDAHQFEQLVESQAASGIAAIRVQQQHLAPILVEGAVEIHAEGIVERGQASRFLAAQPLGESRKVPLREPANSHLGVEVGQRHVFGEVETPEKPQRGGFREPAVAPHAAAGVEQHTQMKRHGVEVAGHAAGKIGDHFAARVFGDDEVLDGQPRDRVAGSVHDGDGDPHQIHATAKHRLGLDRRHRRTEQEHHRPTSDHGTHHHGGMLPRSGRRRRRLGRGRRGVGTGV